MLLCETPGSGGGENAFGYGMSWQGPHAIRGTALRMWPGIFLSPQANGHVSPGPRGARLPGAHGQSPC